MQKNILKYIFPAVTGILILSGCTKKLDLNPTNDITSNNVYKTPLGYKEALAKIYGSLALIGNNGPGGGPDISTQIVQDPGSQDFIRMLWYLQCLSTDEAGWTYHSNTDPLDIHQMAWSSANQSVAGLYYRCYFGITLDNDFIRQSSDANLSSRGITGASADSIRRYRAEARFLRALEYWVLLDLYGNVPYVTENDVVGGGVLPKQIQRKDLFSYIESELKAIESSLAEPHMNEYPRADKAADWALLARLYLNAQVYTGTAHYTDVITYTNKIINAGYSLHGNYKELMLADNNLNTDENIFMIAYDATHTQTYGGTTFLVHGPAGVTPDSSGSNGNWGCIRITQQFVSKFNNNDIRGQFWTATQKLNMDTLLDAPKNGYSSTKFRNKTRTGAPAPDADPSNVFSDIDFPVFRLAEIYLDYAEAVMQGGTGGDQATAMSYLRLLSERAHPNDPNADTYPQLNSSYIIDERGRELFWECIRRTDLIRFNLFTSGNYLWAWKGGVQNGTGVDNKYNLYPIPTIDLSANPNLKQNTGY